MAKIEKKLRLKELRIEAGLTQEQCAAKLETGLRKYINYESSKCEPRYEFLLRAADFYGITLDELMYHKRLRERIFTEKQLEFLRKVRRLPARGRSAVRQLLSDICEGQSQQG